MNYDYLPPEHRPGGERARHDDWPWGFRWVPRTWTTAECVKPPKQIWGNQKYWIDNHTGDIIVGFSSGNSLVKYKDEDNCDVELYTSEPQSSFNEEPYGPAPIPEPTQWQFSIVYAGEKKFPLLYFAYRFKSGRAFWAGFGRWTNPVLGDKILYSYIELFAFGFRIIKS